MIDIFALVTYLPGDDSYRFHIYSEESVPLFGPSLPSPPIFPKVSDFREFLLVKREDLVGIDPEPSFLTIPSFFLSIPAVINGEKAAFNTPIFSQKRERTLDMLIRDMYAEVMTEHRGVTCLRRWHPIRLTRHVAVSPLGYHPFNRVFRDGRLVKSCPKVAAVPVVEKRPVR